MVLGIVEYINKKNIIFASFATDGIDGNSKAAGALADYTSYTRAIKKNCNPLSFLNENNSYEFFNKIGDLILTGSTGTNVMDIQIIIK
jgi:glycerate-2-kinase